MRLASDSPFGPAIRRYKLQKTKKLYPHVAKVSNVSPESISGSISRGNREKGGRYRKTGRASAEDFESLGAGGRGAVIGIEAKLQLGRLRHHARIPGRIEHHLDLDLTHLG